MMRLATPPPPVTHPTISFCSGPDLVCTVSWDSLVSSAIAMVLTVVLVFYVTSQVRPGVPNRFQMVFELIYNYIRGLVRDTVGESGVFAIPLALTIFIYILIANWLAIFPIPEPLHPANSDLNQTAAMAMVVFVVVHAYALRVHGLGGYLRWYTRPFELPWAFRIFPFLFLNIIEEIAKPLTLALRLFGNLFGGIVMIYVLSVILVQIPIPILPDVASVILISVWKLFDVFVIGTLQAFIFMLLTVVYFGLAREGLDEAHHGPHPTAPSAAPAT
jgi:F-type H+-transporting ATPase subunit a